MDEEIQSIRDRYWKIWSMAQMDPQYRMLLLRLREIDREYDRVMQSLDREQQNIVSDFVSLCEEMSLRMLEIACEYIVFTE